MTNWAIWQPRVRATLLFIVREGKILLIRKKRGFGAGKINGPGGKVDSDETPLQSALRETFEELGVTPLDTEQRGVTVISGRVHDFEGEPRETDEAAPLWTPLDAIPYDKMWADDRYWLPLLIHGARFTGFFEFDGEQLLHRKVVVRSN